MLYGGVGNFSSGKVTGLFENFGDKVTTSFGQWQINLISNTITNTGAAKSAKASVDNKN